MPLRPEDLIREEILALTAYHVPDARGMVKLDAMENPYGLPDELRDAVGLLARDAPLNRYPDPSGAALRQRLRQVMEVLPGMEILLGNGSDEIIQMLCLAVAKPGAVALGVDPSFVMFRMIATFAGLRYQSVPLGDGFALDREAMLAALERHRPALTFLAYPNNPTGNLFDPDDLEEVVRRAPGLVVVDEAYTAFAGTSLLGRLPSHPNLLVMRTLSKLGLAGLRLGFLVGRPEWLAEFDKLRLPYNVNVLSQVVAERLLASPEVLYEQAAAIRIARAVLLERLIELPGVDALPSAANFILFQVADADAVFARLRARGVLVKNLNGSHPRLAGCLRVTVGTPEENQAFLDALRAALAD
jgi:histidinol-phosphate aminotransferase